MATTRPRTFNVYLFKCQPISQQTPICRRGTADPGRFIHRHPARLFIGIRPDLGTLEIDPSILEQQAADTTVTLPTTSRTVARMESSFRRDARDGKVAKSDSFSTSPMVACHATYGCAPPGSTTVVGCAGRGNPPLRRPRPRHHQKGPAQGGLFDLN